MPIVIGDLDDIFMVIFGEKEQKVWSQTVFNSCFSFFHDILDEKNINGLCNRLSVR